MTSQTKKVNRVIGANIKYERNYEGMTQEQLAKKLRLSRISIVNIECGRQGLTMLNLIRISKHLNVPVKKLLNGL
jgi:transcriptional regulator with XRE-family HTH domain